MAEIFISDPLTNTFIHLSPQPTPISTADYTFSLQWLYSPTCPESDSLTLINWSTLVILRVHLQNPNYVLLSSVRDRTLRLDPCSIIYVREGNPLNNEWLCLFILFLYIILYLWFFHSFAVNYFKLPASPIAKFSAWKWWVQLSVH